MVKTKGIRLELVGYTMDQKMVVKNIYRFFETSGIDLADIFEWCHNNNCLPSWLHLYEEAIKAGMKGERIFSKLENPVIDIWGKDYWIGLKKKLIKFIGIGKSADELMQNQLPNSNWMTRERMTAIAKEAARTEEIPTDSGVSNKPNLKIRLTSNILFEYSGIKKTLFKAGQEFQINRPAFKWEMKNGYPIETKKVIGYWVGTEYAPKAKSLKNLNMTAPDQLIETMVLLWECEFVETIKTHTRMHLECLYCQERYSNTIDNTSSCSNCGAAKYALVKLNQPKLSLKDRQKELRK